MPKVSNNNHSKGNIKTLYSKAYDEITSENYYNAIQKFKEILKCLPKSPDGKTEIKIKHQSHYQLGICLLEYAKSLTTHEKIFNLLYAVKQLALAKIKANDSDTVSETFHIQKKIQQVFHQLEKISTDKFNEYRSGIKKSYIQFFKPMAIVVKEMSRLLKSDHTLRKDFTENSKQFVRYLHSIAIPANESRLALACTILLTKLDRNYNLSETKKSKKVAEINPNTDLDDKNNDSDSTEQYYSDKNGEMVRKNNEVLKRKVDIGSTTLKQSDDESPEEPLIKRNKSLIESPSVTKSNISSLFYHNNNNNNQNNHTLSIITPSSTEKPKWEDCKTVEELRICLAKNFAACADEDVPLLVKNYMKYELGFYKPIQNIQKEPANEQANTNVITSPQAPTKIN